MVESDPLKPEGDGSLPPSLKFLFDPNRDQVPNKPYYEDANSELYSRDNRKLRRSLKKKTDVKEAIVAFYTEHF